MIRLYSRYACPWKNGFSVNESHEKKQVAYLFRRGVMPSESDGMSGEWLGIVSVQET